MIEHVFTRRAGPAIQHYYRIMLLLAFLLVFLAMPVTPISAQGSLSDWSPPVNFSEVPDLFSDSPVLLCDYNQNLHALWVEHDANQAVVYYRTDASGDWSQQHDVLVTRSIRFTDATITPDAMLHLVWVTSHSAELQYTHVPLAKAFDPHSWQVPKTLMQDLDAGSNVFAGGGTLRSDEHGRLHVIASKRNDTNSLSHTLYYMRSDTGGQTWSSPVAVMEIAAPEPSDVFGGLAIDGAGRLHVVWQTRSTEYAAFSELGYTRSIDDGVTWAPQMTLAKGSGRFGVAMPAVFAFGEDEIHLTWDTPDRLHGWSTDGGSTWSTPTLIMSLGAAFGGFNKLAKDSAGTLHAIAATGDGVYSATWLGEAWSKMESVDERTIDPHTQQLEVCQGNRLHVVFHDRTGENEIWYSSTTTNAPELARTAIPISVPAATRTALVEADRSATRVSPTVTPRTPKVLASEPSSAPAAASAVTATIFGATTSAVLVIGVVVAALSRRRR